MKFRFQANNGKTVHILNEDQAVATIDGKPFNQCKINGEPAEEWFIDHTGKMYMNNQPVYESNFVVA